MRWLIVLSLVIISSAQAKDFDLNYLTPYCKPETKEKFPAMYLRLQGQYIKKIWKLNEKKYQALPEVVRDAGQVLFPESLPDFEMKQAYLVCFMRRDALHNALMDAKIEPEKLKNFRDNYLACLDFHFQYESGAKKFIMACYRKIIP